MSPKEQGNWLINKFYNLHAWEVMELHKRKIEYDIAKQAAIICVEQIIQELDQIRKPEYTTFIIDYNTHESMDGYEKNTYWEKVLEEVKKS